jgi:N-acetylneuraminic acid mutarotase
MTFATASILIFAAGSSIQASHDEGWGQGPSMPIPLGEVGAAVIEGKLYVAGFSGAQVTVFDLTTETWAPADAVTPRPHSGHHHAAQSLHGNLYLIGGGGGAEGKVQIYDPNTNTWSLGADMPYAASSVGSCVIDGEIYVAGGQVPGVGSVGETAKYNPESDSWTSLATMPHGHNHAASGTDGERFWVFGGRGGGPGTSVQVYDPSTNQWESSHLPDGTLTPLPLGRGGMGNAPFLLGEFYVMGGEGGTPLLHDRVDIYNPATNTWRIGIPLPMARHGIYPVASNGRIYVAGGGETVFAFAETATLQILAVPDSYEAWRSRQFTTTELEDPEKEFTHWGPNADLDNDGLDTLLEYLMNLDPHLPDDFSSSIKFDQQKLTLRYRKSKNSPDGILQAEASTKLGSWNRDGISESIGEDFEDAWIIETVVGLNGTSSKFVRLSGTLIEEVP